MAVRPSRSTELSSFYKRRRAGFPFFPFLALSLTLLLNVLCCVYLGLDHGDLSLGHLRGRLVRLLDWGFLLGQGEFHVARAAHVGVDSTVGSVGPPSSLLGLVDLDVRNVKVVDVQALDLGVALGVAQQVQENLDSLLWPSTLAVGGTLVLGLGGSADAAAESAEDDHALVLKNVLEVLLGLVQTHLLDGHGTFACVLEVNTQVASASLGRLGCVCWFSGVLHHGV